MLGVTTGSLVNSIYEGVKPVKPEIGMGATFVMWSDRHAYTIVGVSPSGKTIKLQRDNAIRTDKNGMGDAQEYRYEPDTKAYIETATLRKDGKYRMSGYTTGGTVLINVRDEYYDYSF